MTRVIHTGDTHIGYEQYNHPDRRRDFLEAFQCVIDDAIELDVDAVVHAGDLFHDRRPGLTDLQGTVEALRRLAERDIPFLAIVGNHESKRGAQWLDLFEDLDLATRLRRTPTVVDDVAFYGLDYVSRSNRMSLEYEFDSVESDHAVLVGHGMFEPFAHADWDTSEVLDASTVDFDALLLGDNHAPETVMVEDTWVTYCGSTERTSAAEQEERGYNLVAFDSEITIRRRAIEGTREFVFVEAEIHGNDGKNRVRERLREHNLDDSVVIVDIDGTDDTVTPADVESFALDRGALVARVHDHRDRTAESELSVQFSDPHSAVEDRIGSLGLSPVARSVDELIRDQSIADSNVRDRIEDLVREELSNGLDQFEPVEPNDGDVQAEDPEAVVIDERRRDDSKADGAHGEATETAGRSQTVSSTETPSRSSTVEEESKQEQTESDESESESGQQVSMGDFT